MMHGTVSLKLLRGLVNLLLFQKRKQVLEMISSNPQMNRSGGRGAQTTAEVGLTVTGQSQSYVQWLKLRLSIWPNWVGISPLLGCDTGVFGWVLLSGLKQHSAFIIKVTQSQQEYSPLKWQLLAHQHSTTFCKNYKYCSAKTVYVSSICLDIKGNYQSKFKRICSG
jgi:hypothetical protein